MTKSIVFPLFTMAMESQQIHLSHNLRKNNIWYLHPIKTQIKLRMRSLQSAWRRNIASLAIQNPHSEYCDQTAQMSRLIWIFVLRTWIFSDIATYLYTEL